MFAPKQCLYQKEATSVDSQNCNFLVSAATVQTVASLQTTPCHAAPCRTDYGNLQKFGSTYLHGTVFPPKQYLYQKEATVVDSQKCNFLVSAATVQTVAVL